MIIVTYLLWKALYLAMYLYFLFNHPLNVRFLGSLFSHDTESFTFRSLCMYWRLSYSRFVFDIYAFLLNIVTGCRLTAAPYLECLMVYHWNIVSLLTLFVTLTPSFTFYWTSYYVLLNIYIAWQPDNGGSGEIWNQIKSIFNPVVASMAAIQEQITTPFIQL